MDILISLLAQTQGSPKGNPLAFFFPALFMAILVFMLLSSRSQRKREKREREQMYASMTRNDRVQTMGGIIGTIISVKEDEVVLKVDESTNTKMTFVKTAIQRILGDGQQVGADKK